jgi:hypothetical protein
MRAPVRRIDDPDLVGDAGDAAEARDVVIGRVALELEVDVAFQND